MHNEHWLTSNAFCPFGAPRTNEVTKQGAVTRIDAVVSAATGVTICDRRKNAVTL